MALPRRVHTPNVPPSLDGTHDFLLAYKHQIEQLQENEKREAQKKLNYSTAQLRRRAIERLGAEWANCPWCKLYGTCVAHGGVKKVGRPRSAQKRNKTK